MMHFLFFSFLPFFIFILLLQDPGTPPTRRIWTSIDMGTEIFVNDKEELAEWTLSDFDVLYTSTYS